jgi:riboflavin biosynthesis pyrimidine reductase
VLRELCELATGGARRVAQAASDAILVGAQTIRADNPRLMVGRPSALIAVAT